MKHIRVCASIDESRRIMRARVSALRESLVSGGVMYEGVRYGCDARELLSLVATVAAMGAGVGASRNIFARRTADARVVQHTPQSFRSLSAVVLEFVDACDIREAELLAEINVSEVPHKVDIAAGWPANLAAGASKLK